MLAWKEMRLIVSLLCLTLAVPATALDSAIPGQSLEGIRLGMSRVAAYSMILSRNKYGADWVHTASHHLHNGLMEDDLELSSGKSPILGIEILSRNGSVVQVSRRSDDDTFQNDYTFKLLKRKHTLRERSYDFDGPEDDGIEGYYFDDIHYGVCFVGLSQDVFFLTSKPEVLIIHQPGVSVIPVSQGIIGKRNLGEGGRVYANDEDYRRQSDHARNDY